MLGIGGGPTIEDEEFAIPQMMPNVPGEMPRSASVLAPRLMVKLPAIGQRSILLTSFGNLVEVILKSGNF